MRAAAALLLAVSAAAAEETAAGPARWDDLSRQVIPRIQARNEDFASILREVRKASCTIEVEVRASDSTRSEQGQITYAWEDRDDSGTLTGDEVAVAVGEVSSPRIVPVLGELQKTLARETTGALFGLFAQNHVQCVRIPTGYKLRLEPVKEREVARALGYYLCYLTVGEDYRLESIRAKHDLGGESTTTLKYAERAERLRTTGYRKSLKMPLSQTEQERSDEFTEVEGVPLLSRVVIHSLVTDPDGTLRTDLHCSFRDWRIERRPRPLEPPVPRIPPPPPPPPPATPPGTPPGTPPETPPEGRPPRAARPDFQFRREICRVEEIVVKVAFSPDGRQLAFSPGGTRLLLCDVETGRFGPPLRLGSGDEILSLAWSGDGKLILSGSWNATSKGKVRVHSALGGDTAKWWEEMDTYTGAAAWAPDDSALYLAGVTGRIQILDTNRFEPAGILYVGPMGVADLVFTPRGPAFERQNMRLVVCGRKLLVYDPATLLLVRDCTDVLGGDKWDNVALSWDGALAAVVCRQSGIKSFEVASGRIRSEIRIAEAHATDIAFCPLRGSTLLASSWLDKNVRLFDAGTGEMLQELKAPPTSCVAFSSDGTRIVAGDGGGGLLLWEQGGESPPPPATPPGTTSRGFRPEQDFSADGESIVSVACSPDGKRAALTTGGEHMLLWEIATGRGDAPIAMGQGRGTHVCWAPDGHQMLTSSYLGGACVRNAASGQVLKRLEGAPAMIRWAAWSPDGSRIAACGESGELSLWDAATLAPLPALTADGKGVDTIAFTPFRPGLAAAEVRLVTAGVEKVVVWEAARGSRISELAVGPGNRMPDGVRAQWVAAAISSSGERVALADESSDRIQIHLVRTGERERLLEGHAKPIRALVFSPVVGSDLLVSCGADAKVRVWDGATGECLQILEGHAATVTGAAFTPDGRRLITVSEEGRVRIWVGE